MKNIRSLVFLGLVPLMCISAMAGSWSIDVKAEGTHCFPGESTGKPWKEYDAVVDGAEVIGITHVSPRPRATEMTSLKGWCKAVVKWHSSSPTDLPPKTVSFLAMPVVGGDWDSTASPEGDATLALEGVTGSGDITSNEYGGHHYMNLEKRKPYLIQLDTSSMKLDEEDGLLTAELPQWDVNVKLTLINNSQGDSDGDVYFNYRVQEDTRLVTIDSSSIEPSYYNSAALPPSDNPEGPETAGGPVPGVRELHKPNGDGSKVTDSVAHWRSGTWQVQGIPFTANTPGDWHSPTFDWSVSGEATPSYLYGLPEEEHTASLSLGLNLGTDGQGFPKSSTIKVTVTDGQDGTEGKNTFDVKWHLPYEKTFDLPNGVPRRNVYWVSQNYINQSAIIETIPARTFDYQAAIDDVLALADTAGVPGASETQTIFKALSHISEWGETQEEYHVTAADVHDSHEEFGNTVRQRPDNIQGMTVAKRDELQSLSSDDLRFEHDNYNCYVGRVRNYHKESFLTDKYNEHGYDSSNHVFSHDVTDGQPEFQNLYRLKSSASPRPPIGDREIPPSYNLS